ncbi:MAG: isovaleryl-CoA dehydrogenase, partial [Halopseudomonas sp.]
MYYPSLNFGLDDTVNMLREQIQAFCRSELAPRAAQIDKDNQFPAE